MVSQLDYDRPSGRFAAVLTVTGTGMNTINLPLSGHVDETVELPVANARLTAGRLLRSEDVRMARVHAAQVHGEVVHDIDAAVGMQLRRQVVAGQPLAVADLGKPTMVQRGATVLLVLDSPGIALTGQGEALEAGSIGDRIHVMNPTSRAVIEAEVLAPDRVRVTPGGMPLTDGRRATAAGQVAVR